MTNKINGQMCVDKSDAADHVLKKKRSEVASTGDHI